MLGKVSAYREKDAYLSVIQHFLMFVHRQTKNQLISFSLLFSRPSAVAQPLPEDVDGKRHITYQVS